MAIRVRSLDDMFDDVAASLQPGEPGSRPVYALLLGSGFSYPIVPTPTQMLKSDIAWWRFFNDQHVPGPFCHRSEAIAGNLVTAEQVSEFEKELWQSIHDARSDPLRSFPLGPDGLPDLDKPENLGRAYDAVMSEGLRNDRMRRQYLRDVIRRSGKKVNSAHIFLAGILEAQETWTLGAPFCRTIFTTNFDPLLQRSLQLVNKLYYMTDRPDALDPPDDEESDALHLIYTHGSVHRYQLVNTGDQIRRARKRNAPRLVGYLQRHGVIVIGYSGWRDTTMDALRSCSSFASNLYWCDIHPAETAASRLRPEVLKILQDGVRGAYYVPIPSADEAMRQLHSALELGDVPKFILNPVATVVEQLKSIEMTAEAVVPLGVDAPGPPAESVATLLRQTLEGLKAAELAFLDPKIVQAFSRHAEDVVAKALIARLMNDAFVADSQGKRDEAIALWSSVISEAEVPAPVRARALFNRGVTHREAGRVAEAVADYSVVIEMPDAPAEQKAWALYNRGVIHGEARRTAEEMVDYTAVIEMPDAPAEQKAWALLNRGVVYDHAGHDRKAIEDYSAVIEMLDAPAEPRAWARYNRGGVLGDVGREVEAIEDYSAVITMPGTSGEQKAKALFNRGEAYGSANLVPQAIEDWSAVIEMADAPAEQKAQALVNRGLAYSNTNRREQAAADYARVLEMVDAPAEEKSNALINRGWDRYRLGDVPGLVEDSRKALELVSDDETARANLALGLLVTGDEAGAIAEYERLLTQQPDLEMALSDLHDALAKWPELAGGQRALAMLEGRGELVQRN